MSRLKTLAFAVLAQALVLIFLLALAEAVFRGLNPDYPLRGKNERNFFCRFDPVLGWVPKKNFTGIHEKDGFAVPVRQNRFGLRQSDALSRENTPGKRRIIVLGDSYVWGYGVNDEEVFTAPGVVPSDAVELINFGVSGYGTDQEYLFYERFGGDFAADEVVLALTPYNDFQNNTARNEYGYDKPYFTRTGGRLELHTEHLKRDSFLGAREWFIYHWVTINYLDSLIRKIRLAWKSGSGDGVSVPTQAVRSPESVSAGDREAMELTLGIVEKLKALVESQGRKFAVAFIPYKVHITEGVARNHPLVALFADRLREEKIEYLEPFFLFAREKAGGAVLFNENDNHFSASGHALFARALADPETARQTLNYYHRATGGRGPQPDGRPEAIQGSRSPRR